MGTFFTLPDNFLATLTTYTSDIFNDISPILFLIFGLFVGIYLITFIFDISSILVGRLRSFVGADDDYDDDDEEEEI